LLVTTTHHRGTWNKETAIWSELIPQVVFTPTTSLPSAITDCERWPKRAAMYCPAWAARVAIEIVSVHTEPLQAITEEDAVLEGLIASAPSKDWRDVLWTWGVGHGWYATPRQAYAALWDSINKEPSTWWSCNPEVSVIRFKRWMPESTYWDRPEW
jgi:hypothetical protein